LHHFSSAGYIVNKTQSSAGSKHCEHAPDVSAGLVPLILKFQYSTHRPINNFELTDDSFKFVKPYNLCSLL